ncbi:MAG: hypothetical protein QOF61_2916 [Acidobacteriota bacterium]|jgi:hypothetical protein|nr:hypothetical protein [Acidobacteriota bacterium]
MNSVAEKIFAVLIGVMAATAVAFVTLLLWELLGAYTGVLAMCATAPEWWTFIYFMLGIAILVFAIRSGCRAGKWYLKGCAAKSDLP